MGTNKDVLDARAPAGDTKPYIECSGCRWLGGDATGLSYCDHCKLSPTGGTCRDPQTPNPQSEDRAWRLAELESLHRRTLWLLTLQRPVGEAVLAIELSQGHIDNVTLWRIVSDHETYVRVCRKARAILNRAKRPVAPLRPHRGLVTRLLGLIGIMTDDERNFDQRLRAYVADLLNLQARCRRCEVRPRGDPPQMARLGKADDLGEVGMPLGAAEGPGAAADGPAEVEEPADLMFGPGGDYQVKVNLS